MHFYRILLATKPLRCFGGRHFGTTSSLSAFEHSQVDALMNDLFAEPEYIEKYVKILPATPETVADRIVDYVRQKRRPPSSATSGRLSLAVDVACGTGQNTEAFARHFERVLGTDLNAAMIRAAMAKRVKDSTMTTTALPQANDASSGSIFEPWTKMATSGNVRSPNVTFAVAPAEDLSGAGIADRSVDLLTCSLSLHWFDLNKFFAEARRVLAADGVLAINNRLLTPLHPIDPAKTEQLMAIKADFWNQLPEDIVNGRALSLVVSNYAELEFPVDMKDVFRDVVESTSHRMTVSALLYGIRHYPTFERSFRENAEMADPMLQALQDSVMDVVGEDGRRSDPQSTFVYFKTDHHVLMGRMNAT